MSFGLKAFDASGNTILDTSSFTIRLVTSFDVDYSQSGSITDPRFSGCFALAIPTFVAGYGAAHTASISGNTLYYEGQGTDSRIFVLG